VAVGFGTSQGQVREINEDSLCVFTPYPGTESTSEFLAILGVADGMGGHRAGDLASSFVMEKVKMAFIRGQFKNKYGDLSDLALILKNLVKDINQELYALSKKEKSPGEMGSTLTIGLLKEKMLWLAHVGDSRCYLVSQGKIEQLTKDHSWVAEQVRRGVLSPEEAIGHPRDNVLTQAVGIDPNIEPQIIYREVSYGDRYVFCTDGLTRHVQEKEILEIINKKPNPQRACDSLIELANQRGGEDNITVVIGYITSPLKETREEVVALSEKRARKNITPAKLKNKMIVGILFLVLMAASFFSGFIYRQFLLAKKVDELHRQGLLYYEKGEFAKATLLMESILKIDKRNKAAQELIDKIIKKEERRKE